jgi:hypothetical protein
MTSRGHLIRKYRLIYNLSSRFIILNWVGRFGFLLSPLNCARTGASFRFFSRLLSHSLLGARGCILEFAICD